jgi:DNA polymerase-3 subunit epsilon
MYCSLTEQFGIDNRFCNYGMDDRGEFIPKPDRDIYPQWNSTTSKSKTPRFFLVKQAKLCHHRQGRTAEERSCI